MSPSASTGKSGGIVDVVVVLTGTEPNATEPLSFSLFIRFPTAIAAACSSMYCGRTWGVNSVATTGVRWPLGLGQTEDGEKQCHVFYL